MPLANNQPMPTAARAALLALAAVLYALAFSVPAFWPLIFVAMAPVLVATDRLSPGDAFRWGILFGFAVAALGLTWFWNIFGPGAAALWLIFGLWFGVFFAGRSIMQRGLRPWVALLAAVLWWTAVEFFRAECYPLRCTFLCLGHALAGETSPFKLGARLLGAYGLGTAVIAVNAGIAYAVRTAGVRRLTALIGAACALAALALLPAALEPPAETQGRAIRVALVQNEPGRLDESLRLSRDAASAGPQWILWPELSILSDVKADAGMRGEIEKLARDSGAFVGVGAKLNHPTAAPNFWNAYVLFGPGGESLGEYHKMQPVPLMVDGVPGSDYKVFDTPHGRLGVAICYDADFAWICRRLVANGAEVLAVPILDPEHWGARMRRQHVAATVLRAIENGRYVLRIANAGPTLIIDPAGSIIERREEPSPGVVSGRIFPRAGCTPYARFGWLLPYACQGASVVLLVWAVIAVRRKNM